MIKFFKNERIVKSCQDGKGRTHKSIVFDDAENDSRPTASPLHPVVLTVLPHNIFLNDHQLKSTSETNVTGPAYSRSWDLGTSSPAEYHLPNWET